MSHAKVAWQGGYNYVSGDTLSQKIAIKCAYVSSNALGNVATRYAPNIADIIWNRSVLPIILAWLKKISNRPITDNFLDKCYSYDN